ncbi:hypothetical protein CPB83DRAFT_625353 [Crepidotus variabilis]|uniref:Uncharacterized protein n=1 Tax=Crepidotus variabilis TaxID=179855 RepID=A0A9P6EMH6_9AGAR|nr:hypothetical protein CPB83DRAFT_625353 [Crepidotus variabilis]
MASPSTGGVLAERTDIHKSCKSIETLLNVLNEYCEAAGAVVALQKKLAKVLKETANLKVTGDIASNALLASANIFESLSEVDTKFSKIADKEYDLVSTEVKKWFKKLAKEERTHDEKMANANARIKQAGQAYEKKSKKKTTDASEEHSRYIHLISTLGPEISQEKCNHTLNVSQRHSTTTASVAGCLARLADFEWQKACECVRRFSPTVGPLGTYRSLCEGGWAGPLPTDLPDINPPTNGVSTPRDERNATLRVNEEDIRQLQTPATSTTPEPSGSPIQPRTPLPPQAAAPVSVNDAPQTDQSTSDRPVRDSPTLNRQPQVPLKPAPAPESAPTTPALETLEAPKAPYLSTQNTGSVRSLSAFPAPPTHFPLPRPVPSRQQSLQTSHLEFPSTLNQLAESPTSATDDLSHSGHLGDKDASASRQGRGHLDLPHASGSSRSTQSTNSVPPSPEQRFHQPPTIPEAHEPEPEAQQRQEAVSTEYQRPPPQRAQTSLPEPTYQINSSRPTPPGHRTSSSIDVKPLNVRADSRDSMNANKEFGVLGGGSGTPVASRSRVTENYSRYPKPIERNDTGQSTGSIVAAMRNRYDGQSGLTSPTPRELPRLPMNVGDIAARYQGNDGPASPRNRAGSPPMSRQQSLPLLETASRQAQDSYRQGGMVSPDEDRRRTQRQVELADVQQRQKEQELKERELELEMRARELDRDRMRLQTLREGQDLTGQETGYSRDTRDPNGQGQFGVRPRERRVSLKRQLQRPLSQMELDEEAELAAQQSMTIPPPSTQQQQSYNQMHRFPSSPQQPQMQSRPRPQSHDYSYGAQQQQQHLISPPSQTNLHTPPATLYSPKPSHPPSPLLQSEELQYDPTSSNRYRADSNANSSSHHGPSNDHAPSCGCETCSVSKYRSSGSGPSDQRTPRQQPSLTSIESKGQRSEKSKLGTGWIRRLSMPVGNAFSSDSKKHQSNNSVGSAYALGSGISGGPPSRSGLFSLDSKRNLSTTALGGAQEDGKLARPGGGAGMPAAQGRRSYDVSGASNRSMTNLGLR